MSAIVSPDWLPHFSRLGGIVAEVGGWLSHTAILAREFNLPMIVQVDGLESIPDGAYIEISLDGAVRIIPYEVEAERGLADANAPGRAF